jgi:hypothetical protein
MAYNTFSHAILSASLISYPELALGSGYHATCTTAAVVSLTAGSEVITTNPLLSGGIGVVGSGIATDDARALSGTIGFKKIGAIGMHPVSQLLYNPPLLTDDTAGTNTDSAKAGAQDGPGGVAPMWTGTCSSKGYGNLISVCNQRLMDYTLVSPEGTETISKHRPHLKHAGNTVISSSISGITIALRTSPAAATKSRHQIKGHEHTGVEVQYYLGDPLATSTGGLVISAGLSSQNLGFVGPEHARKRLMGF